MQFCRACCTLSSSSAVDICAGCDGYAGTALMLVGGWGQGGAVQLQPSCYQPQWGGKGLLLNSQPASQNGS